MSADLRQLYQEMIVDHAKRPRNFGPLADSDRDVEGYNPLCGDKVHVHVALDGDRVRDARFEGSGCAISTASASLMTQAVRGKTTDEIERLTENFHEVVTGAVEGPDALETLGKLAVFAGVRDYPTRVKCATLAWHALRAALSGDRAVVSTE